MRLCLTKLADQGSVYTHIAHWRVAGGSGYGNLQLRRAVGLADSLAELEDPADFSGIVLPSLAALVGCDVITYNEIGPALGQTRYAVYLVFALDPTTQPAFAAHVHEHPLVNHYRATGSGEPVMISNFLTQQRFHRLGLYAEFFRSIPVEHQLAVGLPAPGQEVIGVAMSRARHDLRRGTAR